MRLKPWVLVCAVGPVLAVPSVSGAASASTSGVARSASLAEFLEQHAKEVAEQAAAKEAAEREAAVRARQAEEQRAKEEREQNERGEREVRQYNEEVAHDREVANRQEEEDTRREEGVKECVVPSLTDDSLSRARKALRKDHCRLGRVKRAAHSGSSLLVMGQTVKHGSKRPAGTAIGITLGERGGGG